MVKKWAHLSFNSWGYYWIASDWCRGVYFCKMICKWHLHRQLWFCLRWRICVCKRTGTNVLKQIDSIFCQTIDFRFERNHGWVAGSSILEFSLNFAQLFVPVVSLIYQIKRYIVQFDVLRLFQWDVFDNKIIEFKSHQLYRIINLLWLHVVIWWYRQFVCELNHVFIHCSQVCLIPVAESR